MVVEQEVVHQGTVQALDSCQVDLQHLLEAGHIHALQGPITRDASIVHNDVSASGFECSTQSSGGGFLCNVALHRAHRARESLSSVVEGVRGLSGRRAGVKGLWQLAVALGVPHCSLPEGRQQAQGRPLPLPGAPQWPPQCHEQPQ